MDETVGKEARPSLDHHQGHRQRIASLPANQEEDVGSEQTGTGGGTETELDTRTNQGPL